MCADPAHCSVGSEKLSGDEIADFMAYLKGCTNEQVLGVLHKERQAGRYAYAELAKIERDNRGL